MPSLKNVKRWALVTMNTDNLLNQTVVLYNLMRREISYNYMLNSNQIAFILVVWKE